MLPHLFPFRFVEPADGSPRLRPSAASWACRPGGEWPSLLPVEALAQAALMALQRQASGGAGEARPARGVLAGIDGLELQRPPRAGERLEAGAELLGRYGTMVKARVWLERDGQRIAEGELLLALTD